MPIQMLHILNHFARCFPNCDNKLKNVLLIFSDIQTPHRYMSVKARTSSKDRLFSDSVKTFNFLCLFISGGFSNDEH